MPLAAQAVRRTRERWTPRERDLFGHLEQSAWSPDRTRASESRRIQEEAPAKEKALAALKEPGAVQHRKMSGATALERSDESQDP